MVKINRDIKDLIEKNPVALATVMVNGKPNIIGVAYVKVIGEDRLLITDNYMNQTVSDIQNNPNVTLVVWDKEMNGYKLVGAAEYYKSGEWVGQVKSLPENKNHPTKGAILVNVELIIKSA